MPDVGHQTPDSNQRIVQYPVLSQLSSLLKVQFNSILLVMDSEN
jgi:hypothetical protein